MKRLLVVTILAVGMLVGAGSTAVDRLGMAFADGQPPPPPQPTPWLVQA